MKLMKHIKLYEQFINEKTKLISESIKPDEAVYIAKTNYSGTGGKIKKGELWVSNKKVEQEIEDEEDFEDPGTWEYISTWLADPSYEAHVYMEPNMFDDVFMQIDLENPKHAKYRKKLTKWGLDEYGGNYQIAKFIIDKDDDEDELYDKVSDLGFELVDVTAESPRQAVAKENGYNGKQTEIIKDKVWVVQKWKDSFIVVFTDDYGREYDTDELLKLLKKKKFIK